MEIDNSFSNFYSTPQLPTDQRFQASQIVMRTWAVLISVFFLVSSFLHFYFPQKFDTHSFYAQ